MKKYGIVYFYFVLFWAGPLLVSCGSGQPEAMLPKDFDVDWAAEPGGIVLQFSAADDLNMDQGRPASLSVCVYQLSEPRVFEELRGAGHEGLTALAACRKFGDTALAASRYFIEPGQKPEPVFLDRREGAKFVGVAAGYYNLESDRCARVFPIPIASVKDDGWFKWFAKHREPGQLLIKLHFGSDWPETPVDSAGK